MSKWATVLRVGSKAINNPATRAVGRSVGNAVVHPQQTLMGFGKATKTAVIGGGLGYVAWENIAHDKPVVRTAADVLIGEEAVDKGLELADSAADKVGNAVDKAGETITGMKNTLSGVSDSLNGAGNFMKNILGGNGGEMFSNLFSNIGQGKVSGLSIAGLLVSALLVFGRFGFLGKIAGVLLGMMLIGNNSKLEQSASGNQSTQGMRAEESAAHHGGMRR